MNVQNKFAPPIVRSEERHGVAVIRVDGEVDMDTCDEVRAELINCLDRRSGSGVLVLDLNGVTVFGSVGLSLLVEARHRAERRGVGFAVATDRRAVLRPLAETGVGDLVVLRATVREAAEAALVRPPATPPAGD
jgi:anti-sigma B factor antagonist